MFDLKGSLFDLKGYAGGWRGLCDHQGDCWRGRGTQPQPHDGPEEAADRWPPGHQEVPGETSGRSWKRVLMLILQHQA